jgi:hypothetical protein
MHRELNSFTDSLLNAAEVPHAVPRIDVPNVSGVIPSGKVSQAPGLVKAVYSQSTAYMAVAAAEMIIELTTTAQSAETLIKANVEMAVAAVQIANDFRRPNRV